MHPCLTLHTSLGTTPQTLQLPSGARRHWRQQPLPPSWRILARGIETAYHGPEPFETHVDRISALTLFGPRLSFFLSAIWSPASVKTPHRAGLSSPQWPILPLCVSADAAERRECLNPRSSSLTRGSVPCSRETPRSGQVSTALLRLASPRRRQRECS